MKQLNFERLEDIRREMMDLLSEAEKIIRSENQGLYDRCRATWISNIDVGLGGGNFMDNHAFTFEKVFGEVEVEFDEDETDEEAEEDPIV